MGLKCVTPNDKSLRLDTKKKLGSGGFGHVFRGKYDGQEVAVKRILLEDVTNSREETTLQRLDHHENVIKLYHHRDDENFRYFALELCAADLNAFCKGKYKGSPIPSDVEVLLQLATGLEYIHSFNIIHRDIKPGNILISKKNPVVMKWADFGLSKPTNSRGSASLSGFRGTESWVAPEILRRRPLRGSKLSDIFSTGCVFFYFLTRGAHPFSKAINKVGASTNILGDNPVNSHALPDSNFAKTMIIKMIAHNSVDRISLAEIINILRNYLTSGNSLEDVHNNVDIPTTIQFQTDDFIPLTPQSSQTTTPLVKRPQLKQQKIPNNKQENIISIADLFLQKRKKPRWAIKAQVTIKSSPYYQQRYEGSELVQKKKCFFVMLEDGSGKNIKARACSFKLFNKFYSKFQEGKEYLIKKAGFDKRGEEPVLSLLGETEVVLL